MKKFGFLKKQCPRVPKVYRSTQTSARAKREERREKTIGRRRKRDERIEKREERKTKRRLGVHSPSCPRVRTGGFSVLRGKETGRGQIVTRRLATLPNGQGVGGLDKIPSSKVFGASCITCIRSRTKSRPNDEQRTLLVLLIADLWALWNEALQQRLSGALHVICSMWNFQCHRPSAVDAFPSQAQEPT